MTDMRLVVAGAAGRMGSTVIRTARETQGVTLIGALERPESTTIGADAGAVAGIGPIGLSITSDPVPLLRQADGLIDFTSASSTVEFLELTAENRVVHVIGTTGLTEGDDIAIERAAQKTVIVRSHNMSLGLNLLALLVRQVAAILDESFDIEILEKHHNKKVDAPSGTALMLGRAAAEGRHAKLQDKAVFGRGADLSNRNPRKRGEIGFASQRLGSVICDHWVSFGGSGERIELGHLVDDRAVFARGALRGALWGRNRKTGLYDLSDVLGFSKN
jgi:4-hydroxy-tetrahydrodipicolinate reductase